VTDAIPKLTGRVPRERIRMLAFERLTRETLDAFAALADLTGTVSDALDNLGLTGAIPASELRPNLAAARVVGQAVTVRNVERQQSVFRSAGEKINRMGESEAYNLAQRGDVVVIEGLVGMSNMGGQSATLAHREGCAGAIIEGSYRDPDASRALGFPIWARGVTPITGKWRLETIEVNGRVRIAAVSVDAGDLVLADEAGVVFVPLAHVPAVLAECRRIDAGDAQRKRDIDAGIDIATLNDRRYK
jgi:4-hydroxy-4-methyl-2-oxoglutarate aldolase